MAYCMSVITIATDRPTGIRYGLGELGRTWGRFRDEEEIRERITLTYACKNWYQSKLGTSMQRLETAFYKFLQQSGGEIIHGPGGEIDPERV